MPVSAASVFSNLVEPAGGTGISEEVNPKGYFHEMAATVGKTNCKMANSGGMANYNWLEGPQNIGQFQAKWPSTTQAPELIVSTDTKVIALGIMEMRKKV